MVCVWWFYSWVVSWNKAGSEQRFKGGLAGDGEVETKYHTATHLLNAALKQVISKDVHQRGSNITVERMRFDSPPYF